MSDVAVRDEYQPRFGRQVLTLWSGAFASDYVGRAVELPKHNGFMVTTAGGNKARVECEAPRNDDNWQRVDAALAAYAGGRSSKCG